MLCVTYYKDRKRKNISFPRHILGINTRLKITSRCRKNNNSSNRNKVGRGYLGMGIELSYIRHMGIIPCNGDTDEFLPAIGSRWCARSSDFYRNRTTNDGFICLNHRMYPSLLFSFVTWRGIIKLNLIALEMK